MSEESGNISVLPLMICVDQCSACSTTYLSNYATSKDSVDANCIRGCCFHERSGSGIVNTRHEEVVGGGRRI
ncbi:hypothetical protein Tco_1327702 [Tanacetum coccineum]